MILVDTSVLINLLRDKGGDKTDLFRQVLQQEIPFGISVLTYQEIMQGARDKSEWDTLEEYLRSQTIYFLPEKLIFFNNAANLVFDLRRKEITPRGTIDILIALTAIENKLFLLHDDKDFDAISQYHPSLKILNAL